LQRVVLLFKSKDRIDFATAPENADGMPLPAHVLPHHELIFLKFNNSPLPFVITRGIEQGLVDPSAIDALSFPAQANFPSKPSHLCGQFPAVPAASRPLP
jgi:hypothetical protein